MGRHPWVAVLAALLCSACSAGTGATPPAPAPTSPGTPTGGSPAAGTTPSPMPLASIDPGAPTARGTFTWVRRNGPSDGAGPTTAITVSVSRVRATRTGTVLTFWLNAASAPSTLQVLAHDRPEEYPVLTDTRTGTRYRVSTWRSAVDTYCLCSNGSPLTRSTVHPMDAAYAPLPDDVQQVAVSMPGSTGSVTVPVER